MTISSIAPKIPLTVPGAGNLAIDIAVFSKSLDTFQQTGESIVKMMEQSVNPNVGKNFDMTV